MLLRHVAATVVTPLSHLSLINLLLICCMDYTRHDVRRGDNESGGECVCVGKHKQWGGLRGDMLMTQSTISVNNFRYLYAAA